MSKQHPKDPEYTLVPQGVKATHTAMHFYPYSICSGLFLVISCFGWLLMIRFWTFLLLLHVFFQTSGKKRSKIHILVFILLHFYLFESDLNP